MADELRNPQGLAVGDVDPASGNVVDAIVAAAPPNRGQAAASVETHQRAQEAMALEQLRREQRNDEFSQSMAIHHQTMDDATHYYNIQQAQTTLAQKAAAMVDAADFMREQANNPVTGADYEKTTAALHAKYPFAAQDPGVGQMLQTNQLARAQHLEGRKQLDLANQQEVAHGVVPGETMTRNLIAQGLFGDEKDWANPKIYNTNGTVDHNQVAQIAAARQGAHEGTKAQDLERAHDLKIIDAGLGIVKAGAMDDDDNKDFKAVYQAAMSREAGRSSKAPVAQPSTVPGESPKPAAAKAPVVIQNGITYNLQPDGSYK